MRQSSRDNCTNSVDCVTKDIDVYAAENQEPEAVNKDGEGNWTRGRRGITFGSAESRVNAATRNAVARLHQNLGHPCRDDLTKMLHTAGASDGAVLASKHL